MEKNKAIGLKIKQERAALNITLEKLSEKTKIPVPTLSKIEFGKVNTLKQEMLEKIAKALLIPYNELIGEGKQPLKVGIGATLMSAPLLYGIADRKYSSNLRLCYYEVGNKLQDFSTESERGQLPTEKDGLLTAPQLINLLLKEEFQAIFVPSETYEAYGHEFLRVASVMNTAKGAITLLACSTQDSVLTIKNNFINKDYPASAFFYLKGTIADKIIRNNFLSLGEKDKFSFREMEMKKLSEFISSLKNEIAAECNVGKTVFYAGWEPHISHLKTSIEAEQENKLYTAEIDISEFTRVEEPFQYISFDCLIRSSTKEFLKANEDFKEFFKLIRTSINKLNENKAFPGIHPSVTQIAKLLVMKESDAHKALHKMNFELQFYPEWVL